MILTAWSSRLNKHSSWIVRFSDLEWLGYLFLLQGYSYTDSQIQRGRVIFNTSWWPIQPVFQRHGLTLSSPLDRAEEQHCPDTGNRTHLQEPGCRHCLAFLLFSSHLIELQYFNNLSESFSLLGNLQCGPLGTCAKHFAKVFFSRNKHAFRRSLPVSCNKQFLEK